MIIIYSGKRLYLPLVACQVHLASDDQLTYCKYLNKFTLSSNSFYYIGTDSDGNVVCCLATGPYTGVYRRAILGIGQIFQVDIALIDVDRLCSMYNKDGLLGLLAKWFPTAFGSFYMKRLSNRMSKLLHSLRQGDDI